MVRPAHAAHGSCFVPVLAGLRKLPRGLVVGNASVVDRDSQWWAHRYAHNVAQLKYSAASEAVRDAQARWEDAGAALVARVDAAVAKATKEGIELDVDEAFGDAFDAHAEAVRRAWWDLADDCIVLRRADGFITDLRFQGAAGKGGGYPRGGWRRWGGVRDRRRLHRRPRTDGGGVSSVEPRRQRSRKPRSSPTARSLSRVSIAPLGSTS